ncbi:GH22230 [Drosophila grimshawi]|uniref:GH22230 n=1 Tax=Drosophila grimshawi TaxID=7222 RepID=B4K1E1_DROGR|nr:GH22230 [Drosophila grimshawi]
MARSYASSYGRLMMGAALRNNNNKRMMCPVPWMHYCQVRGKCESSGIVIGLYLKEGEKDPQLSPNGEKFDDRVGGKISALVRETGMNGKLGRGRMFSNVDKEFASIVVVGLGREGIGYDAEEVLDVGMENARIAAAVGARALQYQGVQSVYVDSMEYPEQAAEGASMAVRTMDWIEEQALNSFLMVAKGSCEPPLILEISYRGTSPDDRPLQLMGNGLTFNSGGLCLKHKNSLHMQRGALTGAACCVAAIRAAAALSLPINVSALLPLCENMPSGMAAKPGDVITLLNGKTLCIKDTSNAGTVMLADPLIYAQTTQKPRLLVDVGAHNTGVQFGLGSSSTGLWTNSSDLWKQFRKAGSLTGDRVWRMPLWKHFKDLIEPNKTYDMCNKGRGPASSCLAAALLHSIVACADWVHLDTRGTGMLGKVGVPPYLLRDSMTGRPTRTLIQFMYQMACK